MNARDHSNRLADLLHREHDALAEFLVTLADFDRTRGWMALGYSSLFWFLHRELGLSKGAAHYRKTAAELVQRCPAVIEPLRDGRLCLSSVVELAKVLTADNADEVLPRFFHRSKREAMEVTAELRPAPAPALRDVVTVVPPFPPAPAPTQRADPERVVATHDVSSPEGGVGQANLVRANSLALDTGHLVSRDTPAAVREPPRSEVEPLTAELRRLHVTVSKRFVEKLAAATAALSHAMPGATMEQVLEAGLDRVLAERAKRTAEVKRPRSTPPVTTSEDHVPAHLRRAVWARDGGRCQWKLDSGGICASTRQLELDHVVPRALGGTSELPNLRLLCKFHNQLSARQALGDGCMDRFSRIARSASGEPERSAAPTLFP